MSYFDGMCSKERRKCWDASCLFPSPEKKKEEFSQAMARGNTALIVAVALLAVIRLAGAHDPANLLTLLPGQPRVEFKQYSGFITIQESKNLFYWFVTAQNGDPVKQPVAFWFNGGPGCSSLGTGGLRELGPFFVNSSGTGLVFNDKAWNRDANVIFLESPVGVGYSYSLCRSDYESYSDDQTAEDAHAFLVAWFKKFPEYANNDIYLMGESYAGHYVPQLAQKVVYYNEKGGFYINLKGFIVGNAWTDTYSDNRGAVEFHYSHSLISDKTFAALIENCDFDQELPVTSSLMSNSMCRRAAAQAYRVEMAEIDIYNIYAPFCTKPLGSSSHEFKGLSTPASTWTNARAKYPYPDPCVDVTNYYLNRPEVLRAFHVSTSTNLPWKGCSDMVDSRYRNRDITTSVLPVYRHLLKKGLRIWVYSGDTDALVPTLSTRLWLRRLNLPIEIPWYAWNHSGQVGGWTQKYRGITYATVRHAGHMVPLTQPERALSLFEHFLRGEPLPSFFA